MCKKYCGHAIWIDNFDQRNPQKYLHSIIPYRKRELIVLANQYLRTEDKSDLQQKYSKYARRKA